MSSIPSMRDVKRCLNVVVRRSGRCWKSVHVCEGRDGGGGKGGGRGKWRWKRGDIILLGRAHSTLGIFLYLL